MKEQAVWLSITGIGIMTQPIRVSAEEEVWVVMLNETTGQETRTQIWPQPPAQQERKE